MAIFKTIEDFLRKSVYTGPLAKEKPTRAPGSKGYKPTDTSGKKFKPAYMKTVKTKTAGKISKGNGNPYTPTQLKPVGPDMGKVNRNTKGNSVPGTAAVKKKAPVNPALVSKNTPSGVNRMDKTKKKSNKRVHYATMMAKKLMGGGTKRY